MPSFDTISEIDSHELTNAVDPANRELTQRLGKRGIEARCMEKKDPVTNLAEARQDVVLRHGIDQDTGKKLQKLIKDSKLKLQAQIQGDQLRVTGKQRDDLQQAMALLRKAEVDRPLQFKNFRD